RRGRTQDGCGACPQLGTDAIKCGDQRLVRSDTTSKFVARTRDARGTARGGGSRLFARTDAPG
ncbi:MAG: hypothetical protein ABGW98_04260, partial [Myxococcales bacterium]